MYNNPYLYGGAGSGMNFGTNPYYAPYMQSQQFQAPQPVQQQQPQQTTQPQQQPASVNTNKIYVNGLNDVKTKVQFANSDIFYFDNDNPSIVYEKIVDGTGHFEVKTFTLDEKKEEIKKEKSINLSEYAKTTDLQALKDEIKSLNDKIKKLDIENQMLAIEKEKSMGKKSGGQ